ncbi:MAG: tandem-95 repeat protein, partial [Planctomycetales bacterium]|nr:tandem-95 repeat protein [Planctomycetales bacterium]
AADDLADADEDGPAILIDVLDNDTDPDVDSFPPDDVLSIDSVGTPSNGGLASIQGGMISYDPNGAFESLPAGISATDTFTYTISDGNGGTDTATVTVTITGQNDDPSAVDDQALTPLNTAVEIPVLDNDSDIDDGDAFTITGVTQGANGSVVNNTTSVTYTPNGDFEGTDTFTYTITDGSGGSDTATVTLTVGGQNLNPTATDNRYNTDEATDVSGNVVTDDTGDGQDSDPNPADVLVVSEVNGDAGDVGTLITLPSGASLQVDANGGFTYNPSTSSQFNALAQDELATDTFTYSISDGNGGSDTATVTLFLSGLNDAPTATDNLYSGNVAASIVGNIITDDAGSGADSDPDVDGNAPDDVLSVSEVNGDTGNVGTVITLASGATVAVGSDGAMAVDTSTANVNPGSTVTDTFTYTVDDGNGGSDSATVTIRISGGAANQPPVAVDNDFSINEDSPLLVFPGGVLGNDSDPDGDTFSVSAVNGDSGAVGTSISLPSGALLTLNADGTFTYNPNGQFESLPVDGSATDSFTYSIEDEHGLGSIAPATVTITVNGRNDSPVATDNEYSGSVDAAIIGNIISDDTGAGADSDIDAGDVLSVLDINGDIANVGTTVTLASGATLVVGADGGMSIDTTTATIGVGELQTDTFTYTISDGNGGTDTATVSISIAGPGNTDPIAEDDGFRTNEDTALNGDVLVDNGNGADSDADGDTLSVSEVNGVAGDVGQTITLPSGAQLTLNDNGAFTYDPTTSAQFNALAVGELDTDTFTYSISDGNGGADVATVSIVIDGVNDAPTAVDDGSGAAPLETNEETDLVIPVLDNDSDPDGDGLSVTATTDGQNGTVGHDGTDVTYSPAVDFTGTDTFTYTISDGNGGTDTATVTVFVNNVNDPPNLAPIDDQTATIDQELVVTVTATDPDLFDTLDYRLDEDNSPAGATITKLNNNTAEIRWTPTAADLPGPVSFRVLVTDSGNPTEADAESFEVTLEGGNAPPEIDLNGTADGFDSTGEFLWDVDPDNTGSVPIVTTDLSVTAGSEPTIQSATATITNLADGTDEVLSALALGTSLTSAYDSNTGVLTITGPGTAAEFRTVLRRLRYENNALLPTPGERTVEVVLDDGVNTSNTAVARVDVVTLVVDLNGTGAGLNKAEGKFLFGQGTVPITAEDLADANKIAVRQATAGDVTSAEVRILNPLNGTDEVLAVDTANSNITANYDTATNTLTLTGTDTLTKYRDVLRTLTYNNQAGNPDGGETRQIEFTINAGAVSSNQPLWLIDVEELVLDLNGLGAAGIDSETAFVIEGPPVMLMPSELIVLHPNGTTLQGARVALDDPSPFVDEILTFDTTGTNIQGSYDPVTGELLFVGEDTTANYEQVLRSVRYEDQTSTVDPTLVAPDTLFAPGQTMTVPLVANNLAGTLGIDISFTYDPTLFDVAEADIRPGTATAGWTVEINNSAAGVFDLVIFDTLAIGTRRFSATVTGDGVNDSPVAFADILGAGTGSILEVDFHAKPGVNGVSPLEITNLRFNEGAILPEITNGLLFVETPPPPAPLQSGGAVAADNWLLGLSADEAAPSEIIVAASGPATATGSAQQDEPLSTSSDAATDDALASLSSSGDSDDSLDDLLDEIAGDVLSGYDEA